jgi:hypothetical protein
MRTVLPWLTALALVTSAVAVSNPAEAAKDACSGIKSKKDAFGTKEEWNVSDYRLERVNGVPSLVFSAKKGGWFTAAPNTSLPKGSLLEVVFTDGTTWSYSTEQDVMPGSAVIPYVGLVIWWDVHVPLTAEVGATFNTKSIQAFRLTSGGNDFAKGAPSKGDAEKLRVMTACFAPAAAAAAPAAAPAAEPVAAPAAEPAPAPAAEPAPAPAPQ